jgi:hypothetical protein
VFFSTRPNVGFFGPWKISAPTLAFQASVQSYVMRGRRKKSLRSK